jgi:hypothetical protein
MLPPDHPLAPLAARAALATGWPTLHLDAPSEDLALDALRRIEAIVGPCPQADLIEAFEPGDPTSLRVALPGLAQATWEALVEALAPLLPMLWPSATPGATEAQDTQALVADRIEAEPLPATLWAEPDGSGLLSPDLDDEDPDPAGAALASELVAAVAAVVPGLGPTPARIAAFVRHRGTGRRGIRLAVPPEALDPLAGDALLALRRDLVAAVGEVVARRAASTDALAPDLGWDPRLGFALLVWRITAPGPALPDDPPIGPGLTPPLAVLRSAAAALQDRVAMLEIQVVPRTPADHDRVALALAEAAGDAPIDGGRSRWLRAPEPVFCPTWTVEPEDLDAASPWIDAAIAHPDVRGVRVVPAVPRGLDARGAFVDPSWTWMGARCLVRWRDGARDRDVIPLYRTREATDEDAPAIATLTAALQRVPGLPPAAQVPLPVEDSADRRGLAVRLPPGTAPWALSWALGALAGAPVAGACAVLDLAIPPTGAEILMWFGPGEQADPLWGSCG